MSTIPTPALRPPKADSTWPLVLGILGLVFGIGGVLMYGCMANFGMAMVMAMEDFFEQMQQQQPGMEMNAAQMAALKLWAPYTIASNTLIAGVAVVLIVAAVKLLRRRPSARGPWIAWAVLRMIATVPASVVGYFMNRDQFAAMEEAATTGPAPQMGAMFGAMQGLGIVGMVLGLLWAWAFPVFVLVWFSRRAVRDEIAGWSG